jgi:MarR family 2-MHQ and catechol resistance regulon transcriptional repressor
LWVALARAYAAVEGHAAADAARHGLTLAEFGILEALYHKGPLQLCEVQRKILVSSGGITYLVDRLEARKLVRRRAAPFDRRARLVELTGRGVKLIRHAFAEHSGMLDEVLSGLDEGERREATALLRKLGRYAAETDVTTTPATAN